jgi:CRISPR-associated exonuclease Cas4
MSDISAPASLYRDEDLLPISALQHLLYCERQCALIHIERIWSENRYTAEGNILHERAHSHKDETRPGVRTERTLEVRSLSLGLAGQADVVEFHSNGVVNVVEYKRGQPKKNDCDRVQLCAQALCLEEMMGIRIDAGALYYGTNKRRFEVIFDGELREKTRLAAQRLRTLLDVGETPQAFYEDKKCRRCSLLDDCLPSKAERSQSVKEYFSQMLQG